MNIKNKIRIERLKITCFRLFLVSLGIVIGVSWYIAISEYKSVRWVSQDVYVITPVSADYGHTQTEYLVTVEEEETPPSIEEKIKKMFPEEFEIMLAIAKAESKLNPHVVNRSNSDGSIDTGIFQINSIHGYDEEFLKNEDNNLIIARKIYDKQGLNAWSAYKNGAYLKWL